MKKNIFLLEIEEYVAIVLSVALFSINYLFFPHTTSALQIILLMVHYFSFGTPFFLFFFAFIYGLFFYKLFLRIAHVIVDVITSHLLPKRSTLWELFVLALRPIRIVAPFVFVPFATYGLLANMNFAFRFSMNDPIFLSIDHALTGSYIFFDLSRLLTSPSLISILFNFYISLSLALPLLFVALYVYRQTSFYREALIAFMISLVVALPFFALFPLQDIHNYFVRNLRHHDLDPTATLLLQNYHPSPTLSKYLDTVSVAETAVQEDNAVPISCFPSMHAIWGIFIVYYLSRIKKHLLWILIPWLLLLLSGGLMLGQHYLVDYIASVPLSISCIAISRTLISRWDKFKTAGQ